MRLVHPQRQRTRLSHSLPSLFRRQFLHRRHGHSFKVRSNWLSHCALSPCRHHSLSLRHTAAGILAVRDHECRSIRVHCTHRHWRDYWPHRVDWRSNKLDEQELVGRCFARRGGPSLRNDRRLAANAMWMGGRLEYFLIFATLPAVSLIATLPLILSRDGSLDGNYQTLSPNLPPAQGSPSRT